jgi:hypothetical protein
MRRTGIASQSCFKDLVDHGDSPGVASCGERRDQPGLHDFQRKFFREHSLAEREHIAVVVFACQARSFEIPAQRAANAVDLICDDCFAVARTAKHDAALAFAARHSFSGWTNKQRIIDREFAGRAEILDFVAESIQQNFDFFLILVAGVVGTNRDLHARKDRSANTACQGNAERR